MGESNYCLYKHEISTVLIITSVILGGVYNPKYPLHLHCIHPTSKDLVLTVEYRKGCWLGKSEIP